MNELIITAHQAQKTVTAHELLMMVRKLSDIEYTLPNHARNDEEFKIRREDARRALIWMYEFVS